VPAILTGENSLFASSWRWDLISGSGTIGDPSAMITSFNRVLGRGRHGSPDGPQRLGQRFETCHDYSGQYLSDPSTLRFANIKDVLENVVHKGSVKCIACHVTPLVTPTPPILYNVFDRNGSGGPTDATDDACPREIQCRGRVNSARDRAMCRNPMRKLAQERLASIRDSPRAARALSRNHASSVASVGPPLAISVEDV